MIRDKYFLDPTCKLYLPFDRLDGASFASKEQYGHIVTNNGAVRRLKSMYFDGIAAYMLVAADVLDFTSEDFTYLIELNFEDLALYNLMLDRYTNETSGYVIYTTSAGRVEVATHQAGATQLTRSETGTIVTGKGYQVGISRKGTSVRIYVNGKDVTFLAGNHVDPVTHPGDLSIGTLYPEEDVWYQGEIKYVAAYGEAKPALWFETMYQEADK